MNHGFLLHKILQIKATDPSYIILQTTGSRARTLVCHRGKVKIVEAKIYRKITGACLLCFFPAFPGDQAQGREQIKILNLWQNISTSPVEW